MAKFLFELDSRATKFKDRFSAVIQFLLSLAPYLEFIVFLSEVILLLAYLLVLRVLLWWLDVTIEVEDVALVVAAIQGENVDVETRVHVIIFTVVK